MRSITLKDKKQLVLNSNIELGEQESNGKGRYFMSRFIEPGIAHYEELGDILITKETLNKFIQTMVGVPVIIDHEDVTDKNVDKLRVGTVSKVWFNEFDGYFYCEGILTDKDAVDLVKNKGWNVSCAYSFVADETKKQHNGKDIDMEFTDGEFLHLAIVKNPRYEGANIVVNKNDEKGRWITVKGTHIFIPDGADAGEVIEKKFSGTEGYQAKKDYELLEQMHQYQKDVSEYQNRKEKEDKQSDTKDKQSETLKEGKKYTWDNKEYTADELIEQGFRPMKYSGSIYKDDHLTYLEKNDGKKLYRVKISEDEYKELKHKENEKNKSVGLSDVPSLLSDENKFKKFADDLYYNDKNEPHRANVSGELRQKLYHTIHTNSSLTKSEWDERLRRQLKKINKANNSIGDITMTVLNELKEFIKNVVSNEKEEEMKEVKNEDKRKLIDEVGGILKGKVDDEIIRTVIKKCEELSYEPSEDDKADNKAKNEEEKEEAKNKCKNEDDKEEDKKSENEDEEEDEDVTKNEDDKEKKEDKKEVKNSMTDIIMGGKGRVQEQKIYISRKERLEEGNKY